MLPWTGHNAYSLSSSSNQSSQLDSSPIPPASGTNSGSNMIQDALRSTITASTNSAPSDPPVLLPSPPPLAQPPAPVPAPITLSSTLHFLQTEHRRYARDRNEWEIERAEMRARVALLEGEKRGNDGALRDLARRCRMLEGALRAERSKFLSSTNQATNTPSASGASSPLLLPPTISNSPPLPQSAGGLEPHQLRQSSGPGELMKPDAAELVATSEPVSAAIPSHQLVETNPTTASAPSVVESGMSSNAEALAATNKLRGGAAMVSNPILNRVANGYVGSSSHTGGGHTIGGGATGIASSGSHYGQGGAGNASGSNPTGIPGSSTSRDPRGKARSRDYLKQCLQEITYLTASTTLNPLSPASFAVPSVPRPRKTLIPVPAAGVSTPTGPDTDAPTMLSTEGIASGAGEKGALPAGIYIVKGSKAPVSISATSGPFSVPSSPASAPHSNTLLASTYAPAGDTASVFIPLTREGSERGRGSERSVSVEMEGEREGINERRLAAGNTGGAAERKRGAGESSGAWLTSNAPVATASVEEAAVEPSMLPVHKVTQSIYNPIEAVDPPALASESALAAMINTTGADINSIPQLPSPPRSPSPSPPPIVTPFSIPVTSYSTANKLPNESFSTPTDPSLITANQNRGGDSDLDSLILETTRKEEPVFESDESGLVWEDDDGVISTDQPAARFDAGSEEERGKETIGTSGTTKKSGSKNKKNNKKANNATAAPDRVISHSE